MECNIYVQNGLDTIYGKEIGTQHWFFHNPSFILDAVGISGRDCSAHEADMYSS